MTALEKIECYLRTHKKPVTIQQLSDRFLISDSGVRHALQHLKQQNAVQYTLVKQTRYWSIVRRPAVAVSPPVDPPQRPAAPVVKSYAHVRGYDD